MPQTVQIEDFLPHSGTIIDVRSPGEYQQGHIPGAVNLPLFDDQERAEVGTCYKQKGREDAIAIGLELVGSKMANFVRQAKQLPPPLRVHCWRGGMRSSSMGWLFETAGMEVYLLTGGYKSFRRWVREILADPKQLIVLAGMTGTQKTAILEALAAQNQPVLNLEQIANHRGSSYGAYGLPPQPTTEQFENLVAIAWQNFGKDQPIWIEAESRGIGSCRIPTELFDQMLKAPIIEIKRSLSERIAYLEIEYGNADSDSLIAATNRIAKKLGNQQADQAISAIKTGDLATAIAIVLGYYDRTYKYDLSKRQIPIASISISNLTAIEAAKVLIDRLNIQSSEVFLIQRGDSNILPSHMGGLSL
jgi:tRNA 2-selenouridine synthase